MTEVRFESLPLGSTYHVTDTFTTNSGATFTVRPFQWSNLTWTPSGRVRVEDGKHAGGSGHELAVNNVNVGMVFDYPLEMLSLRFGEYGGNLNIEVNGAFENFENFADIDGKVIGDVEVGVEGGLGHDVGMLKLIGRIKAFSVGGQELAIDDVCCE